MSWVRASLGHLVSFGNGQDASGVIEDEGANPVYGSGGEFARTNAFLHEGPSILFGRKGTVDKPRFVDGKFWTIDTVYYAAPQKNVDPKFLYYWATTIPFETLMTNTARPSMTAADLSRLPVDLPPLEEQRRIADYLDAETTEMDALSAQLDELVARLRERRSTVLDTGIWGSGKFDLIQLRSVAGNSGLFVDGDWVESKDQDPDGEIRLLQLADIGDGSFLDKSNRRLTEESFQRLHCTELEPDDILIARMPDPIARATRLPRDLGRCITVVDVAILRVAPSWDPAYVTHALNSCTFRDGVEAELNGSTRQRVPRSKLGRMVLPSVPLDEQRRIVARLDEETAKIDAMIADATKLKELIAERRSALITDVVTGRKQV